jgi:hypothetical protein
MMNFKKATLALMGSMALVATANAGFILVDNVAPTGSGMPVASNNEFAGPLAGLGVTSYVLGTTLGTDSAGSVSFYYYGKEAGYSNQFQAAGGISHTTGFAPSYQNYFSAPIALGSVGVGAGANLLDFQFCAFTWSTTSGGCVTNLQNDALQYSSRQSIAMSLVGDSAWLFWDDSGAGPDDNHDDMVIRAVFTPTQVPEPQTLGLLGAGLLGVWFSMRRRERSSLAA